MSHRGLRARGRLITDHLVDAPAAVPSGEPHPTHLPRVVSCELCGRAGLCGGWVVISVAVGRGRVAGIVLSIGDITRFPTADHLASHTRTAPLETSSSDHQRHRLNITGNRPLNTAVHTTAACQARDPGPGYYPRKIGEDKTPLKPGKPQTTPHQRPLPTHPQRSTTPAKHHHLTHKGALEPHPRHGDRQAARRMRATPNHSGQTAIRASHRPPRPALARATTVDPVNK